MSYTHPLVIVVAVLVVGLIGVMFYRSSVGSGTPDPDLANATGADGLPIVFTYIEREDRRGVERWLAAGGDIEVPGFQQQTPLLKAAVADNWPMAHFLLTEGADPTAYDRSGMTLPYLAATSRVSAGSSDYAGLEKVRTYLTERNMAEPYYEPNEVKEMLATGTWPPTSTQ